MNEPFQVATNTLMHCQSPAVDSIGAEEWSSAVKNPDPIRLDYGFIMDNVEGVQNLSRHLKGRKTIYFYF